MKNSVLAAVVLSLAGVVSVWGQDPIFANPHPIFSPIPDYPLAAKSAGVQGIVAVQVHIDASGAVSDAKVVSGPAPLQDSALQTAKLWKFEPTIIAGKATPVISTINLTFGTPPAGPAASVPVVSAAFPAPRRGVVATTDGDKVIGSLKWEIREETSGTVLASGDGPILLKDVAIEDVLSTRHQTPKQIQLTSDFAISMAEFPSTNVSEKDGFGLTALNTGIQSFSWEWFRVLDSKHATKLQESGELGIDLHLINGFWEVTRTDFTTDVSLRIIRMNVDPPGSPPHWRINIFKGSTITWPSISNGKVSPNE
jgi:TonB family protein